MFNLIENEMGRECFAPCINGPLLLKPLAEKVKRGVAQIVLFFSRWLEKQLVLSNLQHSGFKRNKMNRNDLKRREVFERKASWRETQQPNPHHERTQSAPNQ